MNDDNINRFLSHAIQNGSNENMELECRFGKYNKISSNINQSTFIKIFNLFKNAPKSYAFIQDVLYNDIRKRTTMPDKELVKKMFVDLQKAEDVVVNTASIYEKELKNATSFYLTKTKIFKPIQSENMKMDLVMENISTTTDKPMKETFQKTKFRCTCKEGVWDIDLTIIIVTDSKTKKQGLFYEVEMEFNHKAFVSKKLTQDDVLTEFKKHSDAIVTTIECSKVNRLDVELRYSMFNQVSTLARQDLDKLIYGKYACTEKADGERVFIYIDSKKNMYRINPSSLILDKILVAKSLKLSITNTLIDGELITINGADEFLGFDAMFYNGTDCRNLNLTERLSYLKIAIDAINKNKTSIKFKTKTFYFDEVFINAGKIWRDREKLFKYHLDGLIFTPIRGGYLGNFPNLKWKDKHSIDVRIMYNSKFNFTEFHPHAEAYVKKDNNGNEFVPNAYTDRNTGNIFYTKRINTSNPIYKQMNLVNNMGILGITGRLEAPENLINMADIIEVEYDPEQKKWIYLRKRPDKERPNAYKSIMSVLDAITDNITISELSQIKHKPSAYDVVENKNCHSKAGFNFVVSDITSNTCAFYTYAYSHIIPKGNTILVLGCDICVLRAVAQLNYKNILILESNCLEVYGDQKSEGYTGLKEYAKKEGINATIIWGAVEISDGIKAYTKAGQTEINTFMKKTATFDTIYCNNIINMIHDGNNFIKHTFDKNIKNIKLLTKQFVGVFLNGTQIIKYLEKQDCLLTKNKELHPLYKLYLNNENIIEYKTDIFKLKPNEVKMIEIQKMQNSYISEYQPAIFDKNIDIFKTSGLNIKESKSLKAYFTQFKKENEASIHDCIMSDITNYIICGVD